MMTIHEIEALQNKRLDLIEKSDDLCETGFYMGLENCEKDDLEAIESDIVILESKIYKIDAVLLSCGFGG